MLEQCFWYVMGSYTSILPAIKRELMRLAVMKLEDYVLNRRVG